MTARTRADAVRRSLDELLGTSSAEAAVFMGRIGHGPAPQSRSLRLPLEALEWRESAALVDRAPIANL
jgi:hypothetical protein